MPTRMSESLQNIAELEHEASAVSHLLGRT